MAPEEKPEDGKPQGDETGEVLSNLPRSRRQRPSARRQEARDARAGAADGKAGDREPGHGKPVEETGGLGAGKEPETPGESGAGAASERSRRRVPASGYATVHEPGSYGNADPDELLKSFVRSILRRLPG